ncbi:MAG TPA: hydrogen gas-evolving membrane-bound hydrogenase subunit E, partial [Egibacteraceae bacterium]|nr:hydrogen gas-evolving membrane-bound hydrogenase subunit E [Egibacteraceae bacterium]
PVHRAPVAFWAPAAVLAGLSVAFGLVPNLESPLVEAATAALVPGAHPHPLALWHGFNLALALSGVTVVAGSLLVLARRRVEALQEGLPSPPGSLEAYNATILGVRVLAARTAAITQSGSLPLYLTVILLVAVIAPTTALLAGGSPHLTTARFADSPLQVVAVAAALAAGVAAVRSTRRFAAVLALGAVGYAVVALFALHGAPDLAFTQLLIETLSLLVFVLVLRHLPERFSAHRWRLAQGLRVGLSVAVGVFVSMFALTAAAARRVEGVSGEYLTRSLPEANGHNVVNVILVDFRGLDTLGEITVLAVAGLGIAALVGAVGQGAGPDDGPPPEPGPPAPGAPRGSDHVTRSGAS